MSLLHHFGRYTDIREITGDILKVRARGVGYGELAQVSLAGGRATPAQVIGLEGDTVTLQVFGSTAGLSRRARVRFRGRRLAVTFAPAILGRVFDGTGRPMDGGPTLAGEPQLAVGGPTVNPLVRVMPQRLIRTDVPMIDIFNCLVESQKIPIFSVAGEPHNQLLARIAVRTDAEIVVFGGMGLTFDDYHFFHTTFEEAGVLPRTVMYVNLASDPIVERILVLDLALAVGQQFAVAEGKRVLVLLTDMTAWADAQKEIGIAMEHVPSNRGYLGDLYSQLARRYERACDFKGAGSVTILAVTTMPGGDITHPVPDNTGYITEGQFILRQRRIDPFASLSRLKQQVIGKVTREDHGPLANTMVRLYSEAQAARQKQAMAFDLSDYDHRLLRFGELFEERFMAFDATMGLEEGLDLGWQTLAQCFAAEELFIRRELVAKYFPAVTAGREAGGADPPDEKTTDATGTTAGHDHEPTELQ